MGKGRSRFHDHLPFLDSPGRTLVQRDQQQANWKRPSASTSTRTMKIRSRSFGRKRRTQPWPASLVSRSGPVPPSPLNLRHESLGRETSALGDRPPSRARKNVRGNPDSHLHRHGNRLRHRSSRANKNAMASLDSLLRGNRNYLEARNRIATAARSQWACSAAAAGVNKTALHNSGGFHNEASSFRLRAMIPYKSCRDSALGTLLSV